MRHPWAARTGLAWCVVGVMAGTAVAAPPPDVPPSALEQRQAEAFRRFEAGEQQFQQRNFAGAAELFSQAWRLFEDPAYLFNRGVAYARLGRWSQAIASYEQFLARFPDSPVHATVEARLAEARIGREAERAVIAITTQPPGATARVIGQLGPGCTTPCQLKADPGAVSVSLERGALRHVAAKNLGAKQRWELFHVMASTPPPAPDRTASIVLFAASGAALVGGVVLAVQAQDAYDEGRALARTGPLGADGQRRLAGLRDDVARDSLLADLSFGTAVVGTAVGTVLWLLDGDGASARAAADETGPAAVADGEP